MHADAGQQSTLDRQEQRRRAEQLTAQRQQRQDAPFASVGGKRSLADHTLPQETPCFTLRSIELVGSRTRAFAWMQRYLDGYVGQCTGRAGLELIQRRASDYLIARGFITTRIGVPAQDISPGRLRLLLVPGTVRAVRFAPGSPQLDWHSAFPFREGDLLNLRAIEQGLEQFKRVPSQDVSMDIAPGGGAGESDIVLTVHRARAVHVTIDANDAGLRASGRDQGHIGFSLDNPLGLNDIVNVGISHALLAHDDTGSTRGESASYSLPWGWWTFSLSYSYYQYRQWLDSFDQRFASTGTSSTGDLSISRTIGRSQVSRTGLELHVATRNAHSYLQGVEIRIQRQRVASAELALVHRHYFGAAQLDGRLGYQRGTPWFGSQWQGYDPSIGYPTDRYRLATLDLSLSAPFHLGRQAWSWSSSLHAQTSTDHLPAAELLTIGGRYSVRGFDGERTLAGERGAYWRNELSLPVPAWGLAPYAGLDLGYVGGPQAPDGQRGLGGIFVGLRGSYRGLSWDVFSGWSVCAPQGFETARPATGVQLIYQI